MNQRPDIGMTEWIQATAEACFEQEQLGQPFLPVEEFLDFWAIMERARALSLDRIAKGELQGEG